MFLIDAIKHNVERKKKSGFVSFHVMFSGSNENFIQKKREKKINSTDKLKGVWQITLRINFEKMKRSKVS